MTVLSPLGPGLCCVRKVSGELQGLLIVGVFTVFRKVLVRVAKAVGLAWMILQNTPIAMGIVGTPIEKKWLVLLNERPTILAHGHIVAPTVGNHHIEGKDRFWGVVIFADSAGAVPSLFHQHRQADNMVKTGKVMIAMHMAVGAIGVIVQTGQDG